jgi:hypothetical protein
MSQELPHDHVTKKRVVYSIDGAKPASVRRDIEYRTGDTGPLTIDLYSPHDSSAGVLLPAVVFVIGYSEAGIGMPKALDWPRFKDWAMLASWGELVAASGMIGVVYTNREPTVDLVAVLQHLRQNGAALGIDENRIGLYASSGHVPLALFALINEGRDYLKCAVLNCGYLLDLDGSTGVAEMAAQFGFVHPAAGSSVDDLPNNVPLFIVRASQEQFPHLNDTLDRFVAKALARNLPITLVNHPGPHGFEIMQDGDDARQTVKQMLAFLRFHLRA